MLGKAKKTIQNMIKYRLTFQYFVKKYKGNALWARSYKQSDYIVK